MVNYTQAALGVIEFLKSKDADDFYDIEEKLSDLNSMEKDMFMTKAVKDGVIEEQRQSKFGAKLGVNSEEFLKEHTQN
ncbi:MAG: hypothetical protein ABI151_01825 [Chitinophagaceae bacterium]